jgi:N-methylhydantoinase A/oxoprolinase/acetone carboxylase beta subunit
VDSSSARKGTREACFSKDGRYEAVGVYDGDRLRAGMVVPGPAVVERTTTTVLLGPGDKLTVTPESAFVLTRAA